MTTHKKIKQKTVKIKKKNDDPPSLPKRNKFKAVKVSSSDGYKFDSGLERTRYYQLCVRRNLGHISELQVHAPTYVVHDGYKRQSGKAVAAITYTPDFTYIDEEGRFVVEDVKSPQTARTEGFVLRRKLFEARYEVDISILFEDDI